MNLGDVWPHPAAGGAGLGAGLVPLHKLSQWVTYSLIEPLAAAGVRVAGLDRLTGLAEYRNGGLFVDLGVLVPRHPGIERDTFAPGDEVVVEWRALTVALLDRAGAHGQGSPRSGGREPSAREYPRRRYLGGRTLPRGRAARGRAPDTGRERWNGHVRPGRGRGRRGGTGGRGATPHACAARLGLGSIRARHVRMPMEGKGPATSGASPPPTGDPRGLRGRLEQ